MTTPAFPRRQLPAPVPIKARAAIIELGRTPQGYVLRFFSPLGFHRPIVFAAIAASVNVLLMVVYPRFWVGLTMLGILAALAGAWWGRRIKDREPCVPVTKTVESGGTEAYRTLNLVFWYRRLNRDLAPIVARLELDNLTTEQWYNELGRLFREVDNHPTAYAGLGAAARERFVAASNRRWEQENLRHRYDRLPHYQKMLMVAKHSDAKKRR